MILIAYLVFGALFGRLKIEVGKRAYKVCYSYPGLNSPHSGHYGVLKEYDQVSPGWWRLLAVLLFPWTNTEEETAILVERGVPPITGRGWQTIVWNAVAWPASLVIAAVYWPLSWGTAAIAAAFRLS